MRLPVAIGVSVWRAKSYIHRPIVPSRIWTTARVPSGEIDRFVVASGQRQRLDRSCRIDPHQALLVTHGAARDARERTGRGIFVGRRAFTFLARVHVQRDRRGTAHLRIRGTPRNGEQLVEPCVDEVALRCVAGHVAAAHEDAAGTAGDRLRHDLPLIGSGPGPDGEDQRPVGKYQGPAMADLSLSAIERRHRGRGAACRGYFREARGVRRREVNLTVAAPRATARHECRVSDDLHGTAGHRNFLDLSLRKEAHPAAIRREERTDRSFRTRQHLRLGIVQRAHVELNFSGTPRDVHDTLPVRRHRERCASQMRPPGRRRGAPCSDVVHRRDAPPDAGPANQNRATPAVTRIAARPARQRRAGRSHVRAVPRGRRGRASGSVSSSSSRASPMSRSRRRGSFSRQRRSSRAIGGGVPAGSALPVRLVS